VTDLTVIADDLTGAADTGIAFALAGLPSFVSIGNSPPPDSAQIVSVDTDTRRLSRDEAARKSGEAAKDAYRRGSRTLYKKIDSTLRGTWPPSWRPPSGRRLSTAAVNRRW